MSRWMYLASYSCAFGLDLEVLDDRGVDAADHDGRQRHEADAGGGNAPVAAPNHQQEHQATRIAMPARIDRAGRIALTSV